MPVVRPNGGNSLVGWGLVAQKLDDRILIWGGEWAPVNCVFAFRFDHALPIDGIANPNTWEVIEASGKNNRDH